MKSKKILGMVLSVMLVASACLSGCKFSDIADIGNNSADVGSSDVGTEKPEEPVTPEKPEIETAGFMLCPQKWHLRRIRSQRRTKRA